MCAVAAGRRPSMEGYVAGTGAHGRGEHRRRVRMLPTLNGSPEVGDLRGGMAPLFITSRGLKRGDDLAIQRAEA